MEEKLLYSTQEVMKMLSMSKTTILKAVKNGDIKASLYGNKFYFTKNDIDAFIEGIRVGRDNNGQQ